jgi:glyoxylase I family protein
MPRITGAISIILTVADAAASASWYRDVFEMEVTSEYQSNESHLICMRNAATGLELSVQDYASGLSERFNELRTGLDHVEFFVAERSDLDEWIRRLDQLRIDHSGVKEPPYSKNAMITFRDPDNIQLELFWRGT